MAKQPTLDSSARAARELPYLVGGLRAASAVLGLKVTQKEGGKAWARGLLGSTPAHQCTCKLHAGTQVACRHKSCMQAHNCVMYAQVPGQSVISSCHHVMSTWLGRSQRHFLSSTPTLSSAFEATPLSVIYCAPPY